MHSINSLMTNSLKIRSQSQSLLYVAHPPMASSIAFFFLQASYVCICLKIAFSDQCYRALFVPNFIQSVLPLYQIVSIF